MPKPHSKPMSNPISATADSYGATSRLPAGSTQEAVSPYPRPDEAADARGNTPRKKTRSAIPGVEADARGQAPRKKTRSAIPGVEADARGNTPRKKTRSAIPGVEADARGQAPRKKTRSAIPGVEADARGNTPRKKTRSAVSGVEADARGQRSRKKTRSAVSGVEADARGQRSRKKTRSATPGVEADARGHLPRKKTRPVGRGERSGDRRHRRRSLAFAAIAGPSLPRLSADSRDREGEIALLRSLTNRLLSKRPLDHVQISRYLRILVRAISADSRMPRELTNQEQVDNLIKKVFHKSINDGNLNFYDLVPVRMARPGEKWWPWRQLLPLEFRWRHGIIDPEERWPHEENKHLAEIEAMDRAMAEAYLDDDPDPDEDPGDDECPPLYDEDPDPPPDDVNSPDLTVIPAEAETHPRRWGEAGNDPPPAHRTARARPP